MENIRSNRFLAYGGLTIHDISGLLYYDALIYPIISNDFLDMVANEKIGSKNFTYKDVENKLFEANLIIRKDMILDKEELREFHTKFISKSREDECIYTPLIDKSESQEFSEILTNLFENNDDSIAQEIVKANKNDPEEVIDQFNRFFGGYFLGIISSLDICSATRYLANLALRHGIKVTPRYFWDDVRGTFETGKNEALGVIFSQLPRIDLRDINIDDLIDFLKDDETKIKRRRLFSWQNDIELKLENGDIMIEHVPDLIATLLDDYIRWVKKSKIKLKYERREIVYCFLSSLLTVIKIPEAVKKYFEFKKRKIDLLDDEGVSGRELAYIVHATEKFSK